MARGISVPSAGREHWNPHALDRIVLVDHRPLIGLDQSASRLARDQVARLVRRQRYAQVRLTWANRRLVKVVSRKEGMSVASAFANERSADLVNLPECRLLLAVLVDAIRCLHNGTDKHRTQTAAWVRGENGNARLSFTDVCEGLGADATGLRPGTMVPKDGQRGTLTIRGNCIRDVSEAMRRAWHCPLRARS